MTSVLGWFLVLLILICLGSPFITLWKLRKLKESLDQTPVKIEDRMPPVPIFGSYRKGLSWVKNNQAALPEHLNTYVKQALIFDKLAMIALGIIFLVAAISVFLEL